MSLRLGVARVTVRLLLWTSTMLDDSAASLSGLAEKLQDWIERETRK
jgi:hypothetical protein